MMEMMLRELASFLWIFVIVLIGFSVSEYAAYGYRDPDGYTIVFGFIKRVSQTFGGRDIVATHEDRILVSNMWINGKFIFHMQNMIGYFIWCIICIFHGVAYA